MTFVVRLARDEGGRVTGIVERVRTGEKARFESVAAIAAVIARMVEADHTRSKADDSR
jgi:hypothetical protein